MIEALSLQFMILFLKLSNLSWETKLLNTDIYDGNLCGGHVVIGTE